MPLLLIYTTAILKAFLTHWRHHRSGWSGFLQTTFRPRKVGESRDGSPFACLVSVSALIMCCNAMLRSSHVAGKGSTLSRSFIRGAYTSHAFTGLLEKPWIRRCNNAFFNKHAGDSAAMEIMTCRKDLVYIL